MSYNKRTWANGDLITKERMNNIENGIYDAHDKINVINNKVEENTTDTNTARKDISDIKLQIGTEELTTTSKKLKGAINELGSQIIYKATKQEVEVERQRITNLSTLSEGSTTGDAELIDGRVGADGVIYDNIGDSIRTQVNSKVDLVDMNLINVKLNEELFLQFEEGTYDASLTKITNSKRIRTKKIKIFKNITLKVTYNEEYSVKFYSTGNHSFKDIKNGEYLNTFYNDDINMNMNNNSNICGEDLYFVVSKTIDGVEQEMSLKDVALLDLKITPFYIDDCVLIANCINEGNIYTNLTFEKGKSYSFNIEFDKSNGEKMYIILNTASSYVDDDIHKFVLISHSNSDFSKIIKMDRDYRSMKILFTSSTANKIEVYKVDELANNNKSEIINYTLVQQVMDGSGKYIDSNLGVSVENKINTIVGDRYRFTVNDGYVFVINKNSNNYKYATNMLEIVSDKELYGLTIQKEDKSELSINDKDLIGLKIEHITKRNDSGVYDCIVAAKDSSEIDKNKADIICDGINDEIEIECAINCNVTISNSARVLLLPGTYNIERFRKIKNLNNNIYAQGNIAILTQKSLVNNGRYEVVLEGRYPSHFAKNSATKLIVSKACQQSLENDKTKEYTIFGALRNDPNIVAGSMFDMFALSISNIFISTNGLDKPIICIDGIGYGQLMVSHCGISWNADDDSDLLVYFDTNPPVEGLIGIRGCYGSNRGCKNYIKNTTICGMHEGLAVLGEHFIIEDCLQHHCYYAFTIGNYNVRRKMEHPNIFIGNSVEQCYRFALLNRYGATIESEVAKGEQTLIYIGGSTEGSYANEDGTRTNMLPIKEVVKGSYYGRFETDTTSDVFENDGSGKNILITKYF